MPWLSGAPETSRSSSAAGSGGRRLRRRFQVELTENLSTEDAIEPISEGQLTQDTCRSWKTQSRPSLCRERGFPAASYPLCRGADVPEGQSVIAGIHRAERGQKSPRPDAVQSPGPERSSPVQ